MKKILLMHPERCTGCRVCESVCSLSHDGECNPSRSRIRVIRWETRGIDIPVVCLQCDDPICAQVCPTYAIRRDEQSQAMVTRPEVCLRCNMCALACPFGGTLVAPDKKILRCDLCEGDPLCVKFCETKAIEYIRSDRVGLKKMREAIKGYPEIFRVVTSEK
jgi:carbon-monoxide dehydrogenase iron sulfur subunit